MNVDTNEYSNMHSLTMSMDNIISIEYEIMPSGTEVAMSRDGWDLSQIAQTPWIQEHCGGYVQWL